MSSLSREQIAQKKECLHQLHHQGVSRGWYQQDHQHHWHHQQQIMEVNQHISGSQLAWVQQQTQTVTTGGWVCPGAAQQHQCLSKSY
eukprot:619188-Amphidinium_carterae.1